MQNNLPNVQTTVGVTNWVLKSVSKSVAMLFTIKRKLPNIKLKIENETEHSALRQRYKLRCLKRTNVGPIQSTN